MQRLADVTLALLQWALVVIGLLTVLVPSCPTERMRATLPLCPKSPQARALTTSSRDSDRCSSVSHQG